jgi:hypothetical protein
MTLPSLKCFFELLYRFDAVINVRDCVPIRAARGAVAA